MEAQQGAPDFWQNNDRAQKHIAKLNGLKKAILPVIAFQRKADDIGVMLELVEAADGAERESYEKEITTTVAALIEELDALSICSSHSSWVLSESILDEFAAVRLVSHR